MSGSRITVEVAGNSASLQAAVAKAAESLKGLGAELAKQTTRSTELGKRTVAMNNDVARSFERAATVATSSSRKMAVSYTTSAREQVGASDRLVASLDRTAVAARESALVQERASVAAAAASTRAAERQIASAAKVKHAFGDANSAITRAGKGMSIGLLGAAAASVTLAVKFQSNTARIQTQAGATAKSLDKIRKGLLDLAPVVGYTPNTLADGMYHVVSSMTAAQRATYGVTGELKVMAASAKLAQVGHSNLEETTYALVSALQALHMPLTDVGQLTGQINSIVGAGDMTMTDFVESLKSGLLPAARTAGISLQSIGAAMAAMGDQGMRGSLAGTRLRMSIALLSAPSAAAAKILNTLGLSSKEATSRSEAMSKALEKAGLRTTTLSADLRKPDGISYALQDLKRHLEQSGLTATGAAAVMNKAFGGGRMGATITLLADNLGRVNSKFDQIGRGANAFGHDWQVTTHTTAFQLKQMEAGAAALATRIGTDLLPVVNTGVHDLTDFVHWLEKGTPAAHALELAVGTFAAVGIGSFFASRIKAAITLIKDLRTVAMLPIRMGNVLSGKSTGGAGGLLSSASGGGMGIGGAKSGMGLPGSVMNPIIVAMEAGEFAGLGSMGAAGTVSTEQKVAAAESGAAASAARGAPVAAGIGTQAETGAVAGIMGSLKTGLGALLKGGLIAGGGLMASQAAGSVIGGSTGKAVSTVGTGASIGAGLGSLIGPEGTLAGGITGALVGGFAAFLHDDASKYGNQIADKITKPLGPAVAAAFDPKIARHLNQAQQDTQKGTPVLLPGETGSKRRTAAYAAMAATEMRAAGEQAGKAFIAGESSVRFPSTLQVFKGMQDTLNALPAGARGAAAKTMLGFAQTLQDQGKLPKGAVTTLIQAIEAQFPGMTLALNKATSDTARGVAANLQMKQAITNTQNAVTSITHEFGSQLVPQMKVSSGNMLTSVTTDFLKLKEGAVGQTTAMKQAAQQQMDHLKTVATADATAMATLVSAQMSSMKTAIVSGSSTAATSATGSFNTLATSIGRAMAAGTVATTAGTALIAKALNDELKSFGEKPIPLVALKGLSASQLLGEQKFLTSGSTGGTQAAPGHRATGGWVGAPGERGPDAVPIVVGRGEAVLNHQQQRVVNGALAATGVGSLDSVFNQTRGTRHHMASGGFAPKYGAGGYVWPYSSGITSGRIDEGWDMGGAGQIAAIGNTGPLQQGQSGWPGTGQGFYYQLKDGVRAGQYVYVYENVQRVKPIGYQAKAGEVLANLLPSFPHLESGWATASGAPTSQGVYSEGVAEPQGYDFQRFLEGLAHGKLIGGGGGVGGGTAPQWKDIKAPKVSGSGTITSLAQGALNLATKAANKFGQAHMPTVSSSGGATGMGGIAPGSWTKVATQLGKRFGWGAAEIDAWKGVEQVEDSSYSLTATNPGSGAYGLAQFINGPSEYAQYGGNSTTLVGQLTAMANYIKGRYGTPSGALAHERANNWYAAGGMVRGPVSTFGPPGEAAGSTALPGHSTAEPGLSLRIPGSHYSDPANRALMGHLFNVAIGGHTGSLMDIDLGPADWTGRSIDVTGAGARKMGINPSGFPTGAIGTATMVGSKSTTKAGKPATPSQKSKLKKAKELAAKLKHPQKIRLPHVPKVSDFTSPESTQLDALTTTINGLQGQQGYLTSLNAGGASLQPLVTLTDGSQVVNWGTDGAGEPSGMIDPSTGQLTKGIYDRLSEIGDPGSLDPNKELGIEDIIVNTQIKQQGVAGTVLGQISAWLSDKQKVARLDSRQVDWLTQGLDLTQPAPLGKLAHMFTDLGSGVTVQPAGTTTRGSPGGWFRYYRPTANVLKPFADIVLEKLKEYRDAQALIERWTELKAKIPTERETEDAAITTAFENQRQAISNADKTATFTSGDMLKQALGNMEDQRTAALGKIQRPAHWKGTHKAWTAQAAAERRDIESEYRGREDSLRAAAGKQKLSKALKKAAALFNLGQQEAADKLAINTYYRAQSGTYESDIKGERTTSTSDKTWLGNLKTSIKGQLDSANSAIDTAKSTTIPTLTSSYLDPYSALSLAIKTGQNVSSEPNIPGYLEEISNLKGTIVPPGTSTTATADNSAQIALLQQINLQLEQQHAMDTAQSAVLRGMIPLIPAYEKGGPILRDTLARVHEGEHVVPKGGTLVMRDGGGQPPDIYIHEHYHGNAAALSQFIDKRIAAPDNVRVVSRTIGQRTRMLRG